MLVHMSIAPWTFTTPPAAPRTPEVLILAFSRGPLADDVAMSLSKFGAPSAASVAAADVRTIEAAVDPAWFAAWRSGSLRAIAGGDLDDLAELDAADRVHLVAFAPQAPTDLTYLQAAWALARFLVARGATIVLDVHAMTYRRAAAVPSADLPFDARREVRIIYETTTERPDGAHALHTRGMRKFGAPDLVALCTDADVDAIGAVMAQVVVAVAGGADLAAGAHGIDVDQSMSWNIVDDEHGLAALLALNNSAKVLVDDDGDHLVGIAARLRSAYQRS
jgi:hypothetical protein